MHSLHQYSSGTRIGHGRDQVTPFPIPQKTSRKFYLANRGKEPDSQHGEGFGVALLVLQEIQVK